MTPREPFVPMPMSHRPRILRTTLRTILRTTLLAILLSLQLTLQAGCGGDETASSAPPTPDPFRASTATIEPVEVSDARGVTGSVAAIRRVEPGTKILGRVDAVLVEAGDEVRAGQVLARLEKRDLEASLRQAEAAVRMAEAQATNARAQHERMASLHERGSVTDKNLEDAVAGLRVAEAGVEQARADVHAAEVMLSYATVRSPFAGWVTAKHLEVGDMTRPGAPLFVVEDLSRVKVKVDVPEGTLEGLAEGDEARAEVGGALYPASIHRIVPSADAGSRTFTVELLLDPASSPEVGRLKSGMFARVSLGGGVRQVLILPQEALVSRGQLRGAYVVDDEGTARLRWLRLGEPAAAGAMRGFEILSGLDGGERVILSPPPGLAEGTPIESTEIRKGTSS